MAIGIGWLCEMMRALVAPWTKLNFPSASQRYEFLSIHPSPSASLPFSGQFDSGLRGAAIFPGDLSARDAQLAGELQPAPELSAGDFAVQGVFELPGFSKSQPGVARSRPDLFLKELAAIGVNKVQREIADAPVFGESSETMAVAERVTIGVAEQDGSAAGSPQGLTKIVPRGGLAKVFDGGNLPLASLNAASEDLRA